MAGKGPDGRSSIYRDEQTGRWHGWVSFGVDPTGKRLRRHVQGPTKAAVTAKVADLEHRREAGGGAPSVRRWTVSEWVETWLAGQESRVRPSTMKGYRADVRRLVSTLGDRRLDQVTHTDIEALYRRVAAEPGISAGTVAHLHRTVSACFRAAERAGHLGRSPMVRVSAPSAPPPEVEPLTVDEVRRVLEAARGARNAARWSVALALGLRQGEALGLRWSDIDLDTGRLSVARQLQWRQWKHGCDGGCGHDPGRCPLRHGGGPELSPPKSRAGRRTIALPVPLVHELRAHAAAQAAEAAELGDLWDNELNLVFPAPDGRPMRMETDRQRWFALLDLAGVPRRRLHDARHTAATLLLVQGVSSSVAMTLLGHTDLGVTRRYQHVVDELRRDAAERMGQALWGE